MKERDVSRYLNKRVKELGGEVRRVTWQGRRNAPDKLVLLPGAHCFVEEKRPGKEPTAAQARELKRLQDAGANATKVNTTDEADALLAFMIRTARK
jgi:NADPH-dependent 2,4-dienoyl-CoA reductase/sulfur reductase-like enzyme